MRRLTRRRGWGMRAALVACIILSVLAVLSGLPGGTAVAAAIRPQVGAESVPNLHGWQQDGAWFQRLIYLYASGNAPIQQVANQAGTHAGLTVSQVAHVSTAVRKAWTAMMTADPASLGRTGVAPHPAAQQHILAALRATLTRIAGSRTSAFLAATDQAYAQATAPDWLAANGLSTTAAAVTTHAATTSVPAPGSVGVWATSFELTSSETLADGRTVAPSDAYVALPDAYLKFTNLGDFSAVPSIYQPFYFGSGGSASAPIYSVGIANAQGQAVLSQVVIADVGPWNEDDNWWDPVDTSTTLPSSCPVSSTTVSAVSLDNAQVDGICPGAANWRHTAYYLLYQHQGLPFFQPSSYVPSGTYADPGAFPPTLPLNCPEAALASINYDGAACGRVLPGYNGHAGAWSRTNTANAPILNQSAIDLSPAVDAALGWTYPSSGFIQVNVSQLPSAGATPTVPANLQATPSALFALVTPSAAQSRPLTLTNTGASSLSWTAQAPPWVTLSTTSGTIAAGASQSLTASIAAPGTTTGVFHGTVTFSISGSGGAPPLAVPVTVQVVAG